MTNEVLTPQDWLPCSVFAAVARPKRIFVFPRDALVRRLLASKLWPRDWGAVVRYGVPPPWWARAIAERCRDLGVEPSFVGDLDPLDLHIYLAYWGADPWLRARTRLPFRFLGRGSKKAGGDGGRSSSRMEDWALLKGGRKVEIEGASSEALLGRGILKRIVTLLRESPT